MTSLWGRRSHFMKVLRDRGIEIQHAAVSVSKMIIKLLYNWLSKLQIQLFWVISAFWKDIWYFGLTKKSIKLVKYDSDHFPYLWNNVSAHNHLHLLQFKSNLKSTAYRPDNRAQTSFAVKPPTLPISGSSDESNTQENKEDREITLLLMLQTNVMSSASPAQYPVQLLRRNSECHLSLTLSDIQCYHELINKHELINQQEGTGIIFL